MLFVIKDVAKNYFAKIGVLKASIFDKVPKKSHSRTQHAVTQSLVKWNRMALETWNRASNNP